MSNSAILKSHAFFGNTWFGMEKIFSAMRYFFSSTFGRKHASSGMGKTFGAGAGKNHEPIHMDCERFQTQDRSSYSTCVDVFSSAEPDVVQVNEPAK